MSNESRGGGQELVGPSRPVSQSSVLSPESPTVRPIVAIVGRPNVGKSTLFNRLIGERRAVMHEVPGTTRDRLYGTAEWRGREFTVVDTGGIGVEPDLAGARQGARAPRSIGMPLQVYVLAQVQEAIDEADLILFVVDAASGPLAADADVAELLRRTRKPLVLGANKADGGRRGLNSVEFFELGLGEALPFSALHGTGTGDLLDEVVDRLPPTQALAEDEADLSLAIVGRPNVGKSSLLNTLLGKQRTIVSPVPGTTRDAVDTELTFAGQRVLLIDTAGIRRRGRIRQGVEKFSVLRAVRAIERAEVAVLVLDAVEGITAQDTHVAGYVQEAYKGLIVAVNKWDVIEKDNGTTREFTARIRRELSFVDWASLVFISARTRPPAQDLLRDSVGHSPANIRVLRQRSQAAPLFLPPLPGKPASGGLRLRGHGDAARFQGTGRGLIVILSEAKDPLFWTTGTGPSLRSG